MRVILQGDEKAYTVVDGQAIPMLDGDVLLTPNGCYHGHDNQSEQDAYWIDFLDVPLVQFLGPMFFQIHPQQIEVTTAVNPNSEMRFAFKDFVPKLLNQKEQYPGVKLMELGPPRLSTFDRFVISLTTQQAWTCEKTTSNHMFVVLSGAGTTQVEDQSFNWQRGDMLAIPSWYVHTHHAKEDAILLRVSDLPLMKMLNWERF
jgi:gentisate 1,2-dioxygenase